MKLEKLQRLINECIMLEEGNYIGGNFDVNLKEAQDELTKAQQLLLCSVSGSALHDKVVKQIPDGYKEQISKTIKKHYR